MTSPSDGSGKFDRTTLTNSMPQQALNHGSGNGVSNTAWGYVEHLFWICDCSGTMQANGKMGQLNAAAKEAMHDLAEATKQDLCHSVVVHVIGYSGAGQLIAVPPCRLEDFQWVDLPAEGDPCLDQALSHIAAEIRDLPRRGSPPVVVLIAGGRPADDFGRGLQELTAAPWGKVSVRIAIVMENNDDAGAFQTFTGTGESAIFTVREGDSLGNALGRRTYAALCKALRHKEPESWPDVNLPTREAAIKEHVHEAALARIDKILEADSGNSEAWLWKGLLLSRMYDQRAIGNLDKPPEIHLASVYQWIRASLGYNKDVEDKVIALSRNQLYLCSALFRDEDLQEYPYREAIKCFDNVLRQRQGVEDVLIYQGISYIWTCDMRKALECFDEVLRLNPENAVAWVCKGEACARLEYYPVAMDCFEKVTSLRPQDPFAWQVRGAYYEKMGVRQLATECLEQAARLCGDHT